MAQHVGYFTDNVTFTEGPFVVVCINGYRIEVELEGHHCPVLPHYSIYELLRNEGLYDGKTLDKKKVEKAVDWLNEQVRKGAITRQNGIWKF